LFSDFSVVATLQQQIHDLLIAQSESKRPILHDGSLFLFRFFTAVANTSRSVSGKRADESGKRSLRLKKLPTEKIGIVCSCKLHITCQRKL